MKTLRVRNLREARWWLLAHGEAADLADTDGDRWRVPRPGGEILELSVVVDPEAKPVLDPVALARLAHRLVLGVPFRAELLGSTLLERLVEDLDEALALRAALRGFLSEGADAIPVSDPEAATAFTRAELDRMDGHLRNLHAAMVQERDAAPPEPPHPEDPPPLSEASSTVLLRELPLGRPLVAGLQAAADHAPLVLTPLAELDAGSDRAHRFLVAAEPGEQPGLALLAVITGAGDAVLGRRLLTGSAARVQHASLADALGERPDEAEARARAAIQQLADQLRPMLKAAAAGDERITRSLAPRPGDAAKAFQPPVAAALQEASDAAWRSDDPPRIRANPGQDEVSIDLAPVGALAAGHPLARPFPGAYRALAPHMVPGRVWATWVHHAPDNPRGMRYDGLVWLDDHWAWFPKPWRAAKRVLE